ncbi:MAG: transferrin receptor-like dimerization domain-containing protein, partial [Polyangia bacterium]
MMRPAAVALLLALVATACHPKDPSWSIAPAKAPANPQALNAALRATESALLLPEGLPRRPYFKHSIYAPADLRGYAASVIPGVNESIDRNDAAATVQQLRAL